MAREDASASEELDPLTADPRWPCGEVRRATRSYPEASHAPVVLRPLSFPVNTDLRGYANSLVSL